MAKKYTSTIKKLQNAINTNFGYHLLVNKTQFYSEEADRIVEFIIIKRAIWDENKGKNKNIELFASS